MNKLHSKSWGKWDFPIDSVLSSEFGAYSFIHKIKTT